MNNSTSRRKSILFVYTSFSSFVKNDFDILNTCNLVEKYHYPAVKGVWKNSLAIFRQFFSLLLYGWKYDIFYCWFADYHSFLPVIFAKIFRKKALVVIGGYDVCRIRKLQYGAFCSPFRGWFSASSMRLADTIITVSGYVDRKAKIIAPKVTRQLIYNCISNDVPKLFEGEKSNTILTVGLIGNHRTYLLKGIDTYLETARLLPEITFVMVGVAPTIRTDLFQEIPPNVFLHGVVDADELKKFYRKARIYCQLSRSESFGVSIAEAMSFGCLPIVTNEGGMPEVVGNVGIIVKRDPQLIADVIAKTVLEDDLPDTINIQKRIEKSFTLASRAASILLLTSNK